MKKFALFLLCSALAHAVCFAEVSPNELNRVFGINFLQDENLWDDSAEDFIKRLGAKFEDTTLADGTLYTTYAKGKVLGADIEQLRFKEANKKVAQVDMVFFNKGDSIDGKKWTPQAQRKMRTQWQTLEKTLNELAGKGKNGTWGFGRVKNKAEIWTYENFVFSLEVKPKEFIILHITPVGVTPTANEKTVVSDEFDGKVNIKKNDNGDVYIANIPMIDQGPKGYCVPATIERILKYYNIPNIDMHKIATVCKTQVGGGTTLQSVMSDFKKVGNTFKLKMTNLSGFSINSISTVVDKGIPICWALFSPDPYIKRMLENTDKRQSESDFNAYCKFLKEQPKLPKKLDGAHLCLIIGYNKKSKELAVSNSWGERFEITWVRFEDAKQVSRNTFYINPR